MYVPATYYPVEIEYLKTVEAELSDETIEGKEIYLMKDRNYRLVKITNLEEQLKDFPITHISVYKGGRHYDNGRLIIDFADIEDDKIDLKKVLRKAILQEEKSYHQRLRDSKTVELKKLKRQYVENIQAISNKPQFPIIGGNIRNIKFDYPYITIKLKDINGIFSVEIHESDCGYWEDEDCCSCNSMEDEVEAIYSLELQFDIRENEVIAKNITGYVPKYDIHIGHHPHISDDGIICFGSLADEIVEAFAKRDYSTVVDWIIMLVRTHTPSDVYTSFTKCLLMNYLDLPNLFDKIYFNQNKEENNNDSNSKDNMGGDDVPRAKDF